MARVSSWGKRGPLFFRGGTANPGGADTEKPMRPPCTWHASFPEHSLRHAGARENATSAQTGFPHAQAWHPEQDPKRTARFTFRINHLKLT